MSKRMPVRGQAVKWCVCGEWFASERDEREHIDKCPGPMVKPGRRFVGIGHLEETGYIDPSPSPTAGKP